MRLPGDEELVAYLDGEVDALRRREIDHLLHISPVVRERLATIRQDAAACRDAIGRAQPSWPPADRLWTDLRQRLDAPSGGWTAGLVAWLRYGSPATRLTAAATAACATFALFLWMGAPPVLSASDVLARARRAEAARMVGVSSPVVHRRLRIVRTRSAASDGAVVDSWIAPLSGESRERLESPAADTLWDDLHRVLAANRIDAHALLSPDAYHSWRTRIEGATDRVSRRLENGAEAYAISTVLDRPAAAGEIVRSEYVVRAADWQPLVNHLQVQSAEGVTGYDIQAETYAVVARASLPPDYFAALPRPPAPVHHAAPRPEPQPVPTEPAQEPEPAPAASADDEIAAVHAVHRAGACDREPLRIAPGPAGRIAITGSVGRLDRKEQILAWLVLHPSVEVSIDVASGAAPVDAPGVATDRLLRAANALDSGRTTADTDALKLSLDSFLALIASDRDALLGLAARFSDERLAGATPAARKQLRDILEDHLTALAGNLQRVAALLDGAAAGSAPAVAGDLSGWQQFARDLAEELHRIAEASPADLRRLGALADRIRTAAVPSLTRQVTVP